MLGESWMSGAEFVKSLRKMRPTYKLISKIQNLVGDELPVAFNLSKKYQFVVLVKITSLNH